MGSPRLALNGVSSERFLRRRRMRRRPDGYADIKVEISAENMLAQQAVFASLINGDLQALHSDGILGADIDITLTLAPMA